MNDSKFKIALFLRLILVTLFVSFINDSFCSDLYRVTTDKLYIRTGAGKQFEKSDSLKKDEEIRIDEIIDGWGRIENSESEPGFVSMDFVQMVNEEKGSTDSNAPTRDWTKAIFPLLVVFGPLIYFFLFRSGSNSKSSSKNQSAEKIQFLYECRHCREIVRLAQTPSIQHCQAKSIKGHDWRKLGIVGNVHYSCDYCGLGIYTKHKPEQTPCSAKAIGNHNWSKS